jgi:outer membrane protein OmpA-like peptidoglycan-associated protein
MKRKYVLFVIALLLVMRVSAQQKEYTGEIYVTLQSLQQEEDSVYVKLSFDISGVNVDSRRSISLVPALVGADNRLDLPEVVVKGRKNYNVYQREIALMSNRQKAVYALKAPYAVIPGFKSKKSRTIDYDVTVKYSSWMADAKLDMYEDLCGCGNPARRLGITMLANQITLDKIIEPYEITPYMAYIQPDTEPVKRREIVSEAFLNFVVNKIDIRPDYMNNPHELKKVTDLLSEVKNDKDVTVRAIKVIGYASPEGLLSNNQRLSEGRAKALTDYLASRFDYPRSL